MRVMQSLRTLYPREQLTEERFDLMVDLLADVPDDALTAAAHEHQLTGHYFPSVAELRQLAAERTLSLPDETGALSQVEARMTWARQPERDRGDAPPIHRLVREALEHVGGFHAFRSADKPAVVRGQFVAYYREARASAIRANVVAPLALEPGGPVQPHG